jgi:hypothetical protein
MTEIIEHSNSGQGDGGVVRVGDGDQQVSLKVYQDIYHQVTGRTEQIRKRQFDNLLLEYTDIEQLHHKVMQLCDVHRVVARNETISVFHDRERKEQFTSFTRFQAYNANATSPCVSVVLKYNFSLIPAGIEKPQEYVVLFRLTSRVALVDQLDDEAPPFLRGGAYFGYVHESTAEVTVDYVDYVIARGFLEAFDEWVKGCKSIPQNKLLNFGRRHSHWIPLAARLAIAALITWFCWQALAVLAQTNAPIEQWARLGLLFVGGGFIFVSLISAAASFIERAIVGYPELSYIKLNRGDVKLIEAFSNRRNGAIWRFVVGSLVSIILGILSSKIEKLL